MSELPLLSVGANQPKAIRDYETLGIARFTLITTCRRGASPRHDTSLHVGANQPKAIRDQAVAIYPCRRGASPRHDISLLVGANQPKAIRDQAVA